MKKALLWLLVISLIAVFSLAGCKEASAKEEAAPAEEAAVKEEAAPAEEAPAEEVSKELIVYSPHTLEFIDPLVKEFENLTGIKVELIAAGTGELLARIESEQENPLGDIMWGGSLSTLGPHTDLFEEFISENEDDILDDFKNTEGTITRFTAIPSVLIVNTNLIGDIKVDGYESLLNPELKGKIANADPSKSSSSFEQLLNQLYAMGKGDPEKGWDYVAKLIEQFDGKLLDSSSAVPKGVSDGEYVVGLTYEMVAAEYYKAGAPIEIIYPVEGTIIKPDGICIIKGAKNLDNAKAFVNFCTSYEAQTKIAQELNRRSVRKDVKPAEGLKPIEEIYIIYDDNEWNVENKEKILEKYKELLIK